MFSLTWVEPILQNYIARLTHGWPFNDVPKDWYDAAILCDENHITYSAFQSTLQFTQATTITGGGAHHNPVPRDTKPMDSDQVTTVTPFIIITPRPTHDPNAMDVDVTHR